ncbi:MAG: hypothetical protein K9M57_00070 [Phycisphaerae bacterium]|nr:hypothetical protein [Phycisphaerae bacterium]
MMNSNDYNMPESNKNASTNRKKFPIRPGHISRWLKSHQRLIVLGVVILSIMVWSGAGSIGAEENKSDNQDVIITDEDATPSAKETDDATNDDQKVESSNDMADANAIEEFSPEDLQMMELMERWAKSAEENPGSEESKDLEKQLESVMEKALQKSNPTQPDPVVLPPKKPVVKTQKNNPVKPPIKPNGTKPPVKPIKPVLPNKTTIKPTKSPILTTPTQTSTATTATPAAVNEDTDAKVDPFTPPVDPDSVQIKVKDDIIDLQVLMEHVGKELQLNFLYDSETYPVGKVRLQQYGKIPRNMLLPLLEHVLQKAGFSMVKDAPYIRIVKETDVIKSTPVFPSAHNNLSDASPESLVTHIVEIEYVQASQVKSALAQFTTSLITQIPESNILILTEYPNKLTRLLEIITFLDRAGPVSRMEVLHPKYLPVQDLQKKIETLMTALNAQQAVSSGGSSSVNTPTPNLSKMSPADRMKYIRDQRARKEAAAKAPGTSSTTATTKPLAAKMIAEPRTERLFVIGTDDQIAQVKHLSDLFDVPQPGPDIFLESLPMKHVEAKSVESQIKALFTELYEAKPDPAMGGSDARVPTPISRTPSRSTPSRSAPNPEPSLTGSSPSHGPFMLVDERVNRILIVASREMIDQVKDLLLVLDIPVPGAEFHLNVFEFEYLQAADAAEKLNKLLEALASQKTKEEPSPPTPPTPSSRTSISSRTPVKTPSESGFIKPGDEGPFMITDERTNRLLVVGTDEQVERIRDLLTLLDVPLPGGAIVIKQIKIQYVEAETVSGQLSELIEAINNPDKAKSDSSPSPTPPTSSRTSYPRPPSPGTTPQTKGFVKTGDMGPFMLVEERTNRLIIVGTEEQIVQVEELLGMLDIAGIQIRLDVVELKFVEAESVAGQIAELIEALNSGKPSQSSVKSGTSEGSQPSTPITPIRTSSSYRPPPQASPSKQLLKTSEGGPFLVTDGRTNRLLVVGTDDQIRQVHELLAVLDISGEAILIETYIVEHVNIEKVTEQLMELVPALRSDEPNKTPGKPSSNRTSSTPTRSMPDGLRTPSSSSSSSQSSRSQMVSPSEEGPLLIADPRTYRILVVGTQDQISQVGDLLVILDVPLKIEILPYQMKYIPADTAAEQLSQLLQAINVDEDSSSSSGRPKTSPQLVGPPQPGSPSNRSSLSSRNRSSSSGQGVQLVQATSSGPYLLADVRTSRLIIIGSARKVSEAQEFLSLLDVKVDRTLVSLPVKHVELETITNQVADLLAVLNEQEGAEASSKGLSSSGRRSTRSNTTGRTANSGGITGGITPTNQTSSSSNSVGSLIEIIPAGPFLLANERTSHLLVIGSVKQIEQVQDLLKMLDVDMNFKLYPEQITNVAASELAGQLGNLMVSLTGKDQVYGASSSAGSARSGSSRTGSSTSSRTNTPSGQTMIKVTAQGPYLLPDDSTNRLLVVATDKQYQSVKDLLPVLDVYNEFGQRRLKTYQPKYVNATEVIKILDDLGITNKKESGDMRPRERAGLLDRPDQSVIAGQPGEMAFLPGMEEPDVYVAVLETMNKIFVYGLEYQIKGIDEIMKHIDLDPTDAFGQYEIIPLENQDPEYVSDWLSELLDTDRYEKIGENTKLVDGAEGAPKIVPLVEIYSIGVRGSARQREEIKKIIDVLDRRKPQVFVEAILVQLNESSGLSLGVQLQEIFKSGGDNISVQTPFGFGATMGTSGVLSGSGLTLGYYDTDFVKASIEAMADEGNGKVVSMPRITVNDNEDATMTSERAEPTTEVVLQPGSDTTRETFKGYETAGTTLTIKPHISEGDFLQLEIGLKVDSFDGKSQGSVPPPKNSNDIKTNVTVPNNMIVILGGLKSQNNGTSISKVPLLGDLPLIGSLFRSVNHSETSGYLYVFVKAQIIRSPEDKNNQADFSDLKRISEKAWNEKESRKINFREKPIIPGIKMKKEMDDEGDSSSRETFSSPY